MEYIKKIVRKIYYKNPISYVLFQNFKDRKRLGAFFKIVFALPAIPVWNYLAKLEIRDIEKNDFIYRIRNNKVVFYLPDLNWGGDYIQNRIFLARDYFEIRNLDRAKKYMKTDGIFLDIGANIGNHTLFFCNECRAKKVYAFEPVKKTYKILKRNIVLNQLQDKVITYNSALGQCFSKGGIIYAEDSGGNRVKEEAGGEVKIEPLDSFKIARIDFIKIDVEGYEERVLEGARETLRSNRPVIMIEIFDDNYSRVDGLLSSLGYECELKITDSRDYIYVSKKC